MYFLSETVIVAIVLAAVPWIAAWRFGQRGAWRSASVLVTVLLLSPVVLLIWCLVAVTCGQGIILIVLLAPPVVIASIVVLISAWIAAKTWPHGARRGGD